MIDTLGMRAAALALPEQFRAAVAASAHVPRLPEPNRLTSVVIAGMGGSGIAGDVAVAVGAASSRLPILVHKHYECPGFVGPGTLVLAISFSGNTEETMAMATDAVDRGAQLVAVTSGGALAELAALHGAPVVPVDASIPMPRAGIAAVAVPALSVLSQLGLIDDVADEFDATVAQLDRRVAELGADPSPAASIARRIGRTLPLVYGGGSLGEVAALRWKGQFNENPKIPAFANRVPELTHNEICGWAQHGDVTRQVFTLLQLRHDHEHPQVARRLAMVQEICDEVVADVIEVHAKGEGPLAQLFDLILLGDLVTLQMAADADVDPGPVPILDDIKARLSVPPP